jgi:hypothetical protein
VRSLLVWAWAGVLEGVPEKEPRVKKKGRASEFDFKEPTVAEAMPRG